MIIDFAVWEKSALAAPVREKSGTLFEGSSAETARLSTSYPQWAGQLAIRFCLANIRLWGANPGLNEPFRDNEAGQEL